MNGILVFFRRLALWGLALALLAGGGCVTNRPSPALSAAQRSFDPRYNDWTIILSHYVTEQGVDYARMKAERAEGLLDVALTEMLQVTPEQFDAWSREGKLSFLINAHNAHAMMRVLRHYPVTSLSQTVNLFSTARGVRNILLLGREWSLATLADEITGYPYHEARAAFLLNWCAKGCAPLPAVAVTAQNLEGLLDRQTRAFMADPKNYEYNPKRHILYVSKVLGWFKGPIDRDYNTLWDFIRYYLAKKDLDVIKQHKGNPRVRYLTFDKRLNDIAIKN